MFENIWTGGNGWRQKHGEPKNRLELFRCVLHDNWASILFLNLFYMLFFCPAAVWTAVNLIHIRTLFESGAGTEGLRGITVLLMGNVPLIMITGPARAGMALVMRDWARENVKRPFPVFFKGMKENWKQALIAALITGLFPLILWNQYTVSSLSGFQGFAPFALALAAVLYFLWLLAQSILYHLMVTYDLRFYGHFRNAVLLTIMKLPKAIAVFSAGLFPVVLYTAFVLIKPVMRDALIIIPLLYYFFIGFCLTDLMNASFANYLCDTFLNGS